jgi:hypothetical protein
MGILRNILREITDDRIAEEDLSFRRKGSDRKRCKTLGDGKHPVETVFCTGGTIVFLDPFAVKAHKNRVKREGKGFVMETGERLHTEFLLS